MLASTWFSKVVLCGALAAGLMSCTALPGGALDPLVPTLGLHREEDRPPQRRPEAPVPAEGSASGPSQSRPQGQPLGGPPTRSDWIGRYRDTRGEGEIAITLTQDGSARGGTWRLRTGGTGTFAGALGSDGRTLSFSMQGGERECLATLEGIAEYAGDRIFGSYRGTDCHGTLGDGRLDLRRR